MSFVKSLKRALSVPLKTKVHALAVETLLSSPFHSSALSAESVQPCCSVSGMSHWIESTELEPISVAVPETLIEEPETIVEELGLVIFTEGPELSTMKV